MALAEENCDAGSVESGNDERHVAPQPTRVLVDVGQLDAYPVPLGEAVSVCNAADFDDAGEAGFPIACCVVDAVNEVLFPMLVDLVDLRVHWKLLIIGSDV